MKTSHFFLIALLTGVELLVCASPVQAQYSSRYRYRASYDPMVAQVQAILVQKDLYHHRHHNQVDGIYGSETRHAVEDFQRLAGLPVTGMLDVVTLEALGFQDGRYVPADPAAPSRATGPVPESPAAARPGLPPGDPSEVLTPGEAAALLKVSEEDVLKLLEAGDLAGRKIGPNWRIARSALDDFFRIEEADGEKEHDHEHDHDHADEKKK